eukprot:tig00021572_g22395.t1
MFIQAEWILLRNSKAKLQIGTEEAPFTHKCIIQMNGSPGMPELPKYGAKVLAQRGGVVDMHGVPKLPWTKLAATATAGALQITLIEAVDWDVGGLLAIAGTGFDGTKESEERNITAISADRKTLTLSKPLEFKHLGVVETYGSHTVDMRAEVMYLTRNIVFRGEKISSEQNRFGAAFKSLANAGTASITRVRKSTVRPAAGRRDECRAQIENVEFYNTGQQRICAFHPGMYTMSVWTGCAIHQSWNRAVGAADNVSGLRILRNVASSTDSELAQGGSTPPSSSALQNKVTNFTAYAVQDTCVNSKSVAWTTYSNFKLVDCKKLGVEYWAPVPGRKWNDDDLDAVTPVGTSERDNILRFENMLVVGKSAHSSSFTPQAGVAVTVSYGSTLSNVEFQNLPVAIWAGTKTRVQLPSRACTLRPDLALQRRPIARDGFNVWTQALSFNTVTAKAQFESYTGVGLGVLVDRDGTLTGTVNASVVETTNLTDAYSECSRPAAFVSGSVCTGPTFQRVVFKSLAPTTVYSSGSTCYDLLVADPSTNAVISVACLNLQLRPTYTGAAQQHYFFLGKVGKSYAIQVDNNQDRAINDNPVALPTSLNIRTVLFNVGEVIRLIMDWWSVPAVLYDHIHVSRASPDSTTYVEIRPVTTDEALGSTVGGTNANISATDGSWVLDVGSSLGKPTSWCPPYNWATPTPAPIVGGFVPWSSVFGSVTAGQDVTIVGGQGVAVDVVTPMLGIVTVDNYGWLTFMDGKNMTVSLRAQSIVVKELGKLTIGNSSTRPFLSKAEIVLNISSASGARRRRALAIGNPGLTVYGTLAIYGQPPIPNQARSWTRLAADAAAGATAITVDGDWTGSVGAEIVISPSDWQPAFYDLAVVTAVSVSGATSTLTLDRALSYRHIGTMTPITWSTPGITKNFDMRAEVGILSRNVIIRASNSAGVLVTGSSASVVLDSVAFGGSGQPFFGLETSSIALQLKDLRSGAATVTRCSFRDGLSKAISLSVAPNATVSHNTIFNNSNSAIIIKSSVKCSVTDNLAVYLKFGARSSTDDAAFSVEQSAVGSFARNVAAGSERTGFRLVPSDCNDKDPGLYADNVAHSSLIGVLNLNWQGSASQAKCAKMQVSHQRDRCFLH